MMEIKNMKQNQEVSEGSWERIGHLSECAFH